jgi:hypothetical protein
VLPQQRYEVQVEVGCGGANAQAGVGGAGGDSESNLEVRVHLRARHVLGQETGGGELMVEQGPGTVPGKRLATRRAARSAVVLMRRGCLRGR